MARKYTLKRRAEGQAETRARIVEAAVALHGTVGPVQTTVSMIAEKAGVQRHTFYAHFPDERSLLLACSGHHLEVAPPPDATAWSGLADREERLRVGLGAIYGWFERNAGLLACVLADAERDALVREISDMRFAPHFAGYATALADGADPAMLRLALSFHTWRTLTRDAGLDSAGAAAAMTAAALDSPGRMPRVAAE